MKICQVTPGLLPIPPNGWGAVERIIWEYHLNTIELGHQSTILYLNEVNPNDFDIVHIHVANLALEAHKKGIKYIFSLHDHHAFLYGKDSGVYKENLEAIEKSEMSFVPCKFLIPYFNNHPKLKYFAHGVNNNFFKPNKDIKPKEHKLLCIANNGFANDQSSDRKGFSYAINAAKLLNLPITIGGPSNNKHFFEKENPIYDKLTIKYDLNDEELLNLYQTHTIFLHPSILEAGHPNLTLLEALSCSLPIVGTYEENNNLEGLYKVERDVNQICVGINHIINNYDEYEKKAHLTSEKYSFKNRTIELIELYKEVINKKEINMKEELIKIYEETPINIRTIKRENQIIVNFINGAKVEILGDEEKQYYVEFINSDSGKKIYTTTISNNQWCRPNIEYYINWIIKVYDNDTRDLIYTHRFNCENQRVFIALDSSAIGDTLAWFPLTEEFRKKHNCKLVVCTFHNEWFKDKYPEIEFVEPGDVVYDLYAMYSIGWFYQENDEINYDRIKINFREYNLQYTACSILGLDFKEVKPLISYQKQESNFNNKYVVIAPHASAHAKYWNNPTGWQELVDYIKSKGYDVVMITQEKLGDPWNDSKLYGTLKNVIDKTGDFDITDRMNDIMNAELFIGVGSGLSWLSWGLNQKTVLISGFSEPYTEFSDCIRIFNNKNVCTGCFNTDRLDPGDWEWCPKHKNTDRMYECTKTITSQEVIKGVDKLLNISLNF